MVDAADLKSAGRKTVGVQVPLPPSLKTPAATGFWQGSDGRGGFGVRHVLGTTKPTLHQVLEELAAAGPSGPELSFQLERIAATTTEACGMCKGFTGS